MFPELTDAARGGGWKIHSGPTPRGREASVAAVVLAAIARSNAALDLLILQSVVDGRKAEVCRMQESGV